MADIDIVPKRRSMSWVWILALIVVVALIAWAVMGRNEPARVGAATPASTTPSVTAQPLQLYSV